MAEAFYNYGFYKADHSTFGGKIYVSDFNTDYRGKDNIKGSPIAGRIMQDMKFDMQCRKDKENK